MKCLIVADEFESRLEKAKALGRQKVVSDEDVVFLEAYLHKMAKSMGLEIYGDFYYQLQNKKKLGKVFEVFQLFSDVFYDVSFQDVFLDYLNQDADLKAVHGVVVESFGLYQKALEEQVVFHSMVGALPLLLEQGKKYEMHQDFFEKLPLGIQENFTQADVTLKSRNFLNFKDELNFFHESQKQELNFGFLNFKSSVEAVRYALKRIQEEGVVVLYPEGRGYENLFYLFQSEFYKEREFDLKVSALPEIYELAHKMKVEIHGFESFYLKKKGNKNEAIRQGKFLEKLSLEELLKRFSVSFSEELLEFFSRILVGAKQDLRLDLLDWLKVLDFEFQRERSKCKLTHVGERVAGMGTPVVVPLKEVICLGWSEAMFDFSKHSELCSRAQVLKIEQDLGVSFRQNLRVSSFLKNDFIFDSSVKKTLIYEHKNHKGELVKPGLFKILWEKEKNKGSIPKKEFKFKKEIKSAIFKRNLNSFSASALSLYDDCPHKFYLEKILKLNLDEDMDYEFSPLEEGKVFHKILELADFQKDNKKEVLKALKKLFLNKDFEFYGARKEQLLFVFQEIWKVVEAEKAFLLESGVRVKFKEKPFKFKRAEDFLIKGVVDRVDVDSKGNFLIYDYKRSKASTATMGRYTGSKLQAQLFFYFLIGEENVFSQKGDFVGMQYIDLSTGLRVGGALKKEFVGLPIVKKGKGAFVEEKKREVKIELFQEKLSSVVTGVREYKFGVDDRVSVQTCERCNWKGVCKEFKAGI